MKLLFITSLCFSILTISSLTSIFLIIPDISFSAMTVFSCVFFSSGVAMIPQNFEFLLNGFPVVMAYILMFSIVLSTWFLEEILLRVVRCTPKRILAPGCRY